VLVCDDPDAPAGTWVHWVCYDIPAEVTFLPEDVPKADTLPGGGKQGTTDFRSIGYGARARHPAPTAILLRYTHSTECLIFRPGKQKKEIEKANERACFR